MKVPFNKPCVIGNELDFIHDLVNSGSKFSGDGGYTKKCNQLIKDITASASVLLTTSCTHALEMAAILLDIQPGDEVIMPSFTFVSTANPFVLRGAKIVFVDIAPATMNIDEDLIEAAITPKTKVIVPIHYGAVGCDMDKLMDIAKRHNLWVVEDAAQCIDSYYKGRHLGAIGHLGALSFHDTKNIQCGEGGCLLINDEQLSERAEIIREKGTNRALFLRGEIDKYSWVDKGSSYLPSEFNAAFLYAQLKSVAEVTKDRLQTWENYRTVLRPLFESGALAWQEIPEYCKHNAHIFYIKLKDIDARQEVIEALKAKGISSVFHYVPLHSALAGEKYGRFHGEDVYTTKESERLLRLPMWYGFPFEEEFVNHLLACLTPK